MTNSLEHARFLALTHHHGAFRRDGVTPYFTHVLDVVNRVKHLGEKYQIVAYLHDLVEDTSVTLDDLRQNFSEDIVIAVCLLTKMKGQDYDEYLARISANVLAKQVKIYDMISNLADSPTEKQLVKYAKGLHTLLS